MHRLKGLQGTFTEMLMKNFTEKAGLINILCRLFHPIRPTVFTAREQRDMNPDNNVNMPLAVQIMTNRADLFINAARLLYEKGYTELNLNLGCPSGTVVAKKARGGLFIRTR